MLQQGWNHSFSWQHCRRPASGRCIESQSQKMDEWSCNHPVPGPHSSAHAKRLAGPQRQHTVLLSSEPPEVQGQPWWLVLPLFGQNSLSLSFLPDLDFLPWKEQNNVFSVFTPQPHGQNVRGLRFSRAWTSQPCSFDLYPSRLSSLVVSEDKH